MIIFVPYYIYMHSVLSEHCHCGNRYFILKIFNNDNEVGRYLFINISEFMKIST